MEEENGLRTATAKQMAYIQVLNRCLGETGSVPNKDLSVSEASGLINDLICKARNQGNGSKSYQFVKINEPRLGMAMKECFRRWKGLGRDVYETKRESFKAEVIATYNLFTEIAEVLEQARKGRGILQKPETNPVRIVSSEERKNQTKAES